MTVVFFGMNWFVVNETNSGIGGLALSTTIAATMHLVIMFVLLRRRTKGLQDAFLTASIIRIAAATALLCLVTSMSENILRSVADPLKSNWFALVNIVVPSVLGLGIYTAISFAMRAPEIKPVMGMFDKITARFRRRRPELVTTESL